MKGDRKRFCVWALLMLGIVTAGCRQRREPVVVYTSQDEVYAEPIFRGFEQETGIQVRAVFDTESVKTMSLANRLRAESSHPQCDLFWSNEAMLGVWLAERGVVERGAGLARVGYRSRRLVVARAALSGEPGARPAIKTAEGGIPAPEHLAELTNSLWRGKIVMAYPLFGTTASQFVALRQLWGREPWLEWCRGLVRNRTKIVDGNSVVVQMVDRGEAVLGLTDSDDVTAAVREGKAVEALPATDESLLIPNTLALVRGAPHPAAARRLFNYLRGRAVLEKLMAAGALEGLDASDVKVTGLRPDWEKLGEQYDAAASEMKSIFLR